MYSCFVFDDLLKKHLSDRGEHPALEQAGQSVTYAELDARVEKLAGSLHALGIGRGDRVCIHLGKCVEEVVASFAIARLGAVFVNLNHQLTIRQLHYAAANARVRLLFAERRKAALLLKEGLPECIERVVVLGDKEAPGDERVLRYDALPEAPCPPLTRPVIDTDLCAVLYTSGSTGLPKGVMLSHRNVVQSAMAASTHLENGPEDRVLGVLPLSFDFGLSQLTTMFLVGGTLVLQRMGVAPEIIRSLEEAEITGMATVPTIWIPVTRLLAEQKKVLPRLNYVAVSGGMPPTDVLRSWLDVFPRARKYLMYGMTEGFRSSYLPYRDFERKLGSIGKPLPNVELFVVDPEKGLCGPDEPGELLHRGSLISMGYLDNPEATAEKIRPCPHLAHLIGEEPVLYSGDTVRRDAEGYLWFLARTSTFIKSSDFRISPTEVEDIIFDSGQVTDVVAFGVPDEMLGQVVHAAISTRDGAPLDEKALRLFCTTNMPSYMVPRVFHLWEGAMPRTASGKIARPQVIETFLPKTQT